MSILTRNESRDLVPRTRSRPWSASPPKTLANMRSRGEGPP